jgi:pimeloyl-ACP methyl ester carboxylesterase
MHFLLVHGALGSASQLQPLREALESRDTSVLELDGHGETPATNERYTMEYFARQIGAAITHDTVVFGYSMGGYAALLLAAQRSQGLKGVVTLGTKLAWNPEMAAKEVSRLHAPTILAKVPEFAEQLEERHRGAGGWEAVLRKTATLMTELGAKPLVEDTVLAKIEVSVRLMVGDRDALVTIDETASAARKIPQGQLAVLPGTPHPIEQVRPSVVVSMIEDFLR